MVHVFIVFCHPSADSFTSSVLNQFTAGLREAGVSFEITDLYGMNFSSEMSLTEFERETSYSVDLPLPEDVLQEQEKLNNADLIVFIYPLWWSDCPAKLKGWFDRVYTVGFAYGTDDEFESKLKGKKGLVICCAGHTKEELEEAGIAESIRTVMLYDRMTHVGMEGAGLYLLGGCPEEVNRKNNLAWVYRLGRRLIEI
jgi:NAD(P)H dehydrogenase (quinone)